MSSRGVTSLISAVVIAIAISACSTPDEPRAHVLPPFDEFFVGYADRSAPVDAEDAARLTAGDLLGPVVIHDGHLVALWKRRIARGKVVCETTPRAELPANHRAAVRRAFMRYAAFVQTDLELREIAATISRRSRSV